MMDIERLCIVAETGNAPPEKMALIAGYPHLLAPIFLRNAAQIRNGGIPSVRNGDRPMSRSRIQLSVDLAGSGML
jgi:hypothetical protein